MIIINYYVTGLFIYLAYFLIIILEDTPSSSKKKKHQYTVKQYAMSHQHHPCTASVHCVS
jgi:uncharacterized membrane protein